ncbi:MAG TPA: DMT family transporter [Chloroflexota bacterium]|nr:DMT family transporter [Chloroflexota bacterium]
MLSLTVGVSVVLLALLCTAVAYLLYFYLVEHVGPTKTLTVTYLIPLFGSLWGVLFLKESLTVGMGVGLLLVLFSVIVVNEVRLPRRRLA